jgi:protein ImuA
MRCDGRAEYSCTASSLPLEGLRRKLLRAEKNVGLIGENCPSLTFGISRIDIALGGGLACGTLHEIGYAREPENPIATAFALGLAARFLQTAARASVLWIADDFSFAETGVPYGPGLDQHGLAPEQLITVTAPRFRDVLWAMEEALRCRAVGVVIGETRAHEIDQISARRLALAAAAGGTLGVLLRTAPEDGTCAFTTRWIIRPAALPAASSWSQGQCRGVGPPRLTAQLVRNRRGHLGRWTVEWNSVEQRFELATDFKPVVGTAFDRPNRPAAV